ncbi:nitrate reductase cytochrome c-type subunit [Pseudorhodoplanes sp.]|jgi:cytochrome c-type protein NapB|uniref:nitrate reductase cytochrome c-type subunit n=1 Tax=Pseudorhodoplanes sp. TaxID=1934341 RepID=UPI0039C8DF91
MMNRLSGVLAVSLLAGAVAAMSSALMAQQQPLVSGLRGPVPLDQIGVAPRMTPLANTSQRQVRNYPEQPPVIPHTTEGYEVSVNSNRCLTCHARSRTGESQAPMISITHFMDRDGQFLATISPRRYFCEQCHVPQHMVKAPVQNSFVDVDTVLERAASSERKK